MDFGMLLKFIGVMSYMFLVSYGGESLPRGFDYSKK